MMRQFNYSIGLYFYCLKMIELGIVKYKRKLNRKGDNT